MKCAKCDGHGQLTPDPADRCPDCGGRGYISGCSAKEHWAMVGGKRYKLELDPGSRVHRFSTNRVLRDFVDAAREGKKFDLQDVAMKHGCGEYTTKELLDFYIMLGYSICGLSELDYFKGYQMDACEWRKATKEKA